MLDSPNPNQTGQKGVKQSPQEVKDTILTKFVRLPFKKIFLIGSGVIMGAGIILFSVGKYDPKPASMLSNLDDQEDVFITDLTRNFLVNLQTDSISYGDPSTAEILDDRLESNYRLFFNLESLNTYLVNAEAGFVWNSYVYEVTPSAYTSEVFLEYFRDHPLGDEDLSRLRSSICEKLRNFSGINSCDSSFDRSESFRNLVNQTDQNELQEQIDELERTLDKALRAIDRPRQLRHWGFWLGVPGSLVFFVLGTICVSDYVRQQRQLEKEDIHASRVQLKNVQENLTLGESPWKNSRGILDAYYRGNLAQINRIYNTSLNVMLAGFVLIGGSIFAGIIVAALEKNTIPNGIVEILKEQNNLSEISSENLQLLLDSDGRNSSTIISLVGVGAGIITNFIGATFLFLYQSTLKQASEYTEALGRTNTVGIAMEILSTLPTDEMVPKINETKIEISKLLITQLQNSEDVSSEKIQK